MKLGLIIGGGVLALVVLLFVIRLIALHFVAEKGNATVAEHYKPDEIVIQNPQADGRGLLSKGIAERGNGALVLTKTELAFFPITGTEFKIPLSKVTGVDIVNNHNGYSGRPLLQVKFTTDSGSSDAFAWYVVDQETWRKDIDNLRASSH
jgi:hypothetical protein